MNDLISQDQVTTPNPFPGAPWAGSFGQGCCAHNGTCCRVSISDPWACHDPNKLIPRAEGTRRVRSIGALEWRGLDLDPGRPAYSLDLGIWFPPTWHPVKTGQGMESRGTSHTESAHFQALCPPLTLARSGPAQARLLSGRKASCCPIGMASLPKNAGLRFTTNVQGHQRAL